MIVLVYSLYDISLSHSYNRPVSVFMVLYVLVYSLYLDYDMSLSHSYNRPDIAHSPYVCVLGLHVT